MRGLRGALLGMYLSHIRHHRASCRYNRSKGHEFLTRIAILCCDIGENNIVLGVYPWEERQRNAEEPKQVSSTKSANQLPRPAEQSSTKPAQPDETKHVKGLRTVGMYITLIYHQLQLLTSLQWYLPLHFFQDALGREMMWNRTSVSPTQARFPRRSWRMPMKMDLFDPSGLGVCPIRGVGPKSMLIGQIQIHKQ